MPRAKRLNITPLDLEWLAVILNLDNNMAERPALEELLQSMPSGLYEYPADYEIIKEGDTDTDLFVVYKGKLSVWAKKGFPSLRMAGNLNAGDFFGEISALMNWPRSATVKTETVCEVFEFQAKTFLNLLNTHPALDKQIRQLANERLEKIFFEGL